ncbi:hypothetical protein NDU88_000867 [Pleurodeles waltl]|uniref:Uncharacterized protein n=1 Tax=Pleurodeles waltl TaxID=8319 RepID=A0AAV7P247_PLEWA|nr:hypothetical protein NDU88_000867 [Pleurodeles waltl]
MATSLKQSLELMECGDPNGELAPSASRNTLPQVSVDVDVCLDMTESPGDLTLTGLCASSTSPICEGLLTMTGEGLCCTMQGPSLPEITAQVQGFENLQYDDRAAPAHCFTSEDFLCLDKIHETAPNSRAGKDSCSGQAEVGENFFLISDQSKDSDNSSASSSTDSEIYNSFIAPTTSMMGQCVIKCQEGVTEDDLLKVNPDKAREKINKKKSASRARAMSWDYTGIQQFQLNPEHVFKGPLDSVTNSSGDGLCPSLHLINQTMMEQHKQIQSDNKKARVATKQLQIAVSKIAKTCSEIGERIATIQNVLVC